MAIQYGNRMGMLGQMMQMQANQKQKQMDAIKSAIPTEDERRQKLNLEFGNSLLGKANPKDIFKVDKGNKLIVNPDFNMNFPDLDTAWLEYSQMAEAKNVTPNRAAFEESYNMADDLYRKRISKTLNSATANFDQDDIKKAISGNQGLLKYVMGQAAVDPSLAPYGVSKPSMVEEGYKGLTSGLSKATGVLGVGGALGWATGKGSAPAVNIAKGFAKGVGLPATTGFTIIDNFRKGIFSQKGVGGITPKDADLIKKVANKLDLMGGKPEQKGKQALKMIKNVLKNDGVRGLFKQLSAKVGRKQALMLIGRMGIGGAGLVLPTGVSQVAGSVMAAWTALDIALALKDAYNEDGTKKLKADTTF